MAGVIAGIQRLKDNSFLTHLATGRLILDGGFPTVDPYTFTNGGEPWVAQSWFASVLYAVTEDLAGLQGVRVLVALTTGAVFLLAWRSTRTAETLLGRVVALVPFVLVGVTGFSPRPLVFGLLFLQVAVLVAEEQVKPWVLVPVGWLWLNTHGSWPLGLVALALLALGRWLDERTIAPERRAATWLVGGLLLGSINPYGPRLLLFPLQLLGRREVTSGIIEWQPPDFDDPDQYGFLVLFAIAVLALRRRPSWRAAVPLALLTVASMLAVRNMQVAAVVLLPTVAAGLKGLAPRARLSSGLLPRAVAAVCVVAAVGTSLLRLGQSALDLRAYPEAATDCLAERGLGPTEARVAAPDYVGNYWELRFGPDAAVFVDDRAELTTVELARDFRTLLRGTPGWDERLDRWEIDAVVWPRQLVLAELLDREAGWERAGCDDVGRWAVFVRSTP